MRKLCAWCVLISLCMLSGCGKTAMRAVPPPIPDSFFCAVSIKTDEQTIEADWRMTHGDSVFTIRAPQELAGMCVRIQGETAQISLDDVSAALTEPSCFVALSGAYRQLLADAAEAARTDQGWLYDARATHGAAVLQDAQSGLPMRISIPEQQITAALTAIGVTETETAA